MPKISVIMGIYNTKSKDYLEKSLNSILKQTYTDFELIICDDGSTNECIRWVKEICSDDKRVKLLKNEVNRGLAYTLNYCLSAANGEYIARMDDDDESRIDRFEKQLSYLEKNTDVGLVSCNIKLFNDSGVFGEKKYNENIMKQDFLFNSPIVHPAIMARKKCFDIVGGYCEDKSCIRVEDYDIFMKMFAKKINMKVIQEPIFYYRDDSQTTQRRQQFKYRINETIVRMKNYKILKLYPLGILFVIKPIILGFMPNWLLTKIKKK